LGVCTGENESGEFNINSDNLFTIVDNGDPGVGVDTIDVNFLGAGGVAVPGGAIDSRNFVIVE
jgi:hypothetical protein